MALCPFLAVSGLVDGCFLDGMFLPRTDAVFLPHDHGSQSPFWDRATPSGAPLLVRYPPGILRAALCVLAQRSLHLSKWTLVLLYSWNNPLYHLVPKLRNMKNLSEAVVSRAMEIENMSDKLQAFIESQFRKVSILQRAFLLCS